MSIVYSIIIIVLTCLIFWAWFLFVKKKTSYSRPDALLAGSVLALTQIIATSIVFGLLGLFRWELVYAVNLFIAGILMIYHRHTIVSSLKSLEIKSVLGQLSILTKVVMFLAVIVVAWQIVLGVVLNDVSFDSMNYHLSWGASAVQEGNLGVFSTPVPWINVYPKNLDIWYAWFLLPPAHDWLVDLAQLPFILMAVVAMYSILRRFRYSRDTSALASSLFFFLPVVMHQGVTNYIDIALSALLLTAVNFLFQKQHAYLSALIIGLAGGIILGSKISFLIPLFLIGLVALFSYRKTFDLNLREIVRITGIIVIPLFLLSAYWFGRNHLEFGSFVYPIKIMLGSVTLVAGLIDIGQLIGDNQPLILEGASWINNIFINTYHEAIPRYDMSPGGFGPLWAWLLLPSLIPAVMLWFSQKKWWLLGLIFLFTLFFIASPGNWWWRYVIAFSFVGILAFAEVYEWSRKFKWSYHVLGLFVVGLTLWSMNLSKWPAYIDAQVFTDKIEQGIFTSDFSHRWPIFATITKYQEKGSVVAYDSSWFIVYPLWNSSRSNKVVHIPYNIDWLDQLEKADANYLATKSDSPEYELVQANLNRFELLAEEGIYFYYRVKIH